VALTSAEIKGRVELLLLLLFTAIEFSIGGSSPYTSQTKQKESIYIKETIQKQYKQ
jgi:hypothetical protein